MEFSAWYAGAGAAIVAAWRYIQAIWRRLFLTVFAEAFLLGGTARAALLVCWERGKRSPFRRRIIFGSQQYLVAKDRRAYVAFESLGSEPTLVWFGRVPVFVLGAPRNESDTDVVGLYDDDAAVRLIFVRGTLDLDAFLADGLSLLNERMHRHELGIGVPRFQIHRRFGAGSVHARMANSSTARKVYDGTDPEVLHRVLYGDVKLLHETPADLCPRRKDGNPFAVLAYPEDVQEAIEEARVWRRSEAWFKDHGLTWRRGWLLYGPPGTGKSSLARALAEDLDLPLYCLDLASMGNEEFISAWQEAQGQLPAMVLLEDVDAVFSGRENLLGELGGGLTFDCVLNAVSGVGPANGIFLIITTNHVDKLDPALGVPQDCQNGISMRPGRIDRALYLGPAVRLQRQHIAHRILSEWPELVEPAVAATDGLTVAQVQEHCQRIALGKFWHANRPAAKTSRRAAFSRSPSRRRDAGPRDIQPLRR